MEFSSACSDWTYAGHHLLCPLLMTMLIKLWSQTEWASHQRADRHYVPPPILLCGLSDVEGFDQNCLRQGRREEHWDWGHHESVAWRATEAETFLFFIYAVIDEDEDDNWWCYGGPFSVWDYLTGLQTTLTVIIIPVLTRPRNSGTCSVGQIIRATPSKTHPWSGWSSAVWFQPSTGPIALPALGRSRPGGKNPTWLWWIQTPDFLTCSPTR